MPKAPSYVHDYRMIFFGIGQHRVLTVLDITIILKNYKSSLEYQKKVG